MANVKIGSTSYTGIEWLSVKKANDNSQINFMYADDFLSILSGGSGFDYYENEKITTLGMWASAYFLSYFTTVYLPNLTTIVQNGSFINCVNFIAPKLTDTTNQMFKGGNIRTVDLSALTAIGNYAFAGSGITSLVLRGNTVPTIGNTSNQKANVTVYVPSAMLSSYQADATWQTMASSKNWTLTALEGSAYENPDWFRS